MNKKKMTNKERDAVITHLLQRVALLEQMLEAEQNVLAMYVQFNEDTDKFNKWMTLIIENSQDAKK